MSIPYSLIILSFCCFRNVAAQVRLALQQQYPWLEVTLSNYPPPPLNVLLSKALGAGQFVGLALTFAGDRILPALGFVELPAWYLRMQVWLRRVPRTPDILPISFGV